MASPIRYSQCLRHAERPAVARCRVCGEAYCRECVVEHEHRLVCADCLRREADGGREAGRGGGWLRLGWVAVLHWVVAGAVLWGMFYVVAGLLRRIPADVHDGVIWVPQ